ncbi:MAG: Flp pilus assembly protein CpaB [Rhodanobacter sp.]
MQKVTRVAALLLVAIAVVLAIVAFGLGRRAVRPAETPVASAQDAARGSASQRSGVPVVVAGTTLLQGVPIARASLRVADWPQRPAGGYADADSVAGSVPLVDIPPGSSVTAGLLAHGLAAALKPGERALAVPVDEQAGAGNRIVPGDYVDVFLSLKPSQPPSFDKTAADGTQTRLLLSRLRVLAYGERDLPLPQQGKRAATAGDGAGKQADTGSSRSAPPREGAPPIPRTAVLAVPVGETARLLLGVQNGRLSLAVRPAIDKGQPDEALFPQPRTVLSGRTGLTAEQRQQLGLPENRAYAGIGGAALAGREEPASKPARAHHAGAARGLEIIRGSSSDGRANSP